ncbi:hypothetical protein [Nocardia sp. IFM 10818]
MPSLNSYGLDAHTITVGAHLYLEAAVPVTVIGISEGWISYVPGHHRLEVCVSDALAPSPAPGIVT